MKKIKNDIYQKANIIYSQNGTFVMLSSFVVWACVFLLWLFPLFGLGLGFFAMCFLCLGFKKTILDLISKKVPKIENVFDYAKYCLSAFCLKISTMVLVFLWGLLFVVPGIVMGLNFVYAPYILAEDPKIGAIKAMQQSKKMVYGQRGNIFVLYLTMALFVVLTALVASFLVIVFNMIVLLPVWLNILLTLIFTMFVFFVFVLPYFEIVFASMYQQIKNAEKTTKTQKQTMWYCFVHCFHKPSLPCKLLASQGITSVFCHQFCLNIPNCAFRQNFRENRLCDVALFIAFTNQVCLCKLSCFARHHKCVLPSVLLEYTYRCIQTKLPAK